MEKLCCDLYFSHPISTLFQPLFIFVPVSNCYVMKKYLPAKKIFIFYRYFLPDDNNFLPFYQLFLNFQ